MAKRRRLAPPQNDYLGDTPALETKSMFPRISDLSQPRRSPPIADVAAQASSAAALEEMSDTLRRAREDGRMVQEIPLHQIEAGYLVRDRIAVDEEEMQTLMASIRKRGQQTPIEVTQLHDGCYGLISGWRRFRAISRLAEAGEAQPTVLALLRKPENSSEAYIAMVEENEIRVGLSYYERARIALRAVEQEVFTDEREALRSLYHAASRAKRSKIGSFLTVVRQLDEVLKFPEAIGERTGLSLAKELEQNPLLADQIAAQLQESHPSDGAAEQEMLGLILKRTAPAPEKQSLTPLSEPDIVRDIRPGLQLVQGKAGKITLKGKAVDAQLTADLIAWLQSRN